MRMMQSFFGMVVFMAAAAGGTALAATVDVTPANMNGWTLNSFDDNGNIVNSGPYDGTAAMALGPATPPIGVGSAHLATPVGAGDGAAAIATESLDGTPLSAITSLSYSAYDVTNNGQQFPYLAISISTSNGASPDTLFFEPPYQQPTTGNPGLPDQGAPVQNQWQPWNAFEGGWWDNNGVGSPGSGVVSLATIEAAYPDATIANGGFTGLGGIAMQVGFGSSGETEDGYVDNFTIGVAGVNTTYNFDPSPVPEPGTLTLLIAASAAGIGVWRRKMRRQAAFCLKGQMRDGLIQVFQAATRVRLAVSAAIARRLPASARQRRAFAGAIAAEKHKVHLVVAVQPPDRVPQALLGFDAASAHEGGRQCAAATPVPQTL